MFRRTTVLCVTAIAVLGIVGSADAGMLFGDTFDRPDSADLNASAAGKSGTLGALDWVQSGSGGGTEIADNQLKGVGLDGWKGRMQDPDTKKRGCPRTWPSWTICPDQGPDAVAAINFLTRVSSVNLDPAFCASHGAQNDIKLALKRSGLWAHQLLMVLAWRAWRGPWGSEDRFRV